MNTPQKSLWLVTGSQHLYGPDVLARVAEHSQAIARAYQTEARIPVEVVCRPTVTTAEAIRTLCKAANDDDDCLGLIAWMHTFSPAKMWIAGLGILAKPMLHLHTQFNRDIPWETIDMDFMNLNQSAHGGREFGHLATRMGLVRKVVVGHWQADATIEAVGDWARVAIGVDASRNLRVARFGDNMRSVAVTEGDKVAAQLAFGYTVDGYGVGTLTDWIASISEADVDTLMDEYAATYVVQPSLRADGAARASLVEAARIELGLRGFLDEHGYAAFTNTFEDLHGMRQLPGIATQRLMADGYGFGAEGDWKTAALVRTMKAMAAGLPGGNSFMEDYTYHFDPDGMACLGAHMLEICPSIAGGEVRCEVHPLGIGGKEDPVRLVFDGAAGEALNASVVDMGTHFRMLVNTVTAVVAPEEMPNLPVARVLWQPHPDLPTAAAAWIYGGGAHHTCFSQNLKVDQLADFAEVMGVEFVLIDAETELRRYRRELRWERR